MDRPDQGIQTRHLRDDLVGRVATAAETLGHALLAEHGTLGRQAPTRSGLHDPALWTAGTSRLSAVLRATGSASLTEAAQIASPTQRQALTLAASLAGPVEIMLALGSDDRVVPAAGRNSYRMPLADRAPLLRGSSCTATPPDAFVLDVAERWRDDLLATTLSGRAPDPGAWHADVAGGIAAALGLDPSWEDRVVLSPSGTDVESLLTAVIQGAHERDVLVITVGAREAGSGTIPAAGLTAFRASAPFEVGAQPGEALPGTDQEHVRVTDVELRDAAGRVRRSSDIEAEIEAHIEDAAEHDRAVLVHIMGGSKTGLCCPGPDWVRSWRTRKPHLRMVVDAAQLRMSPRDLRAYLDAGASALITGSKALSAPPFCGALLLDDDLAGDATALAAAGGSLPSGLSRSVSRADLPKSLASLAAGFEDVNVGLQARWHVALTEWRRYQAVPRDERRRVVHHLLDRWRGALDALPGVQVLPPRPGAVPTIVSVAVADADGWMCKPGLAEVYERIVDAPGVYIGQPVELAKDVPAVLRLAVGAATVTRLIEDATRLGSLDQALEAVVGVTVDRFAGAIPVGAMTRS
ncbi:MAG: hypothetical protein WA966_14815 [Ornithinimicrobium sp.]